MRVVPNRIGLCPSCRTQLVGEAESAPGDSDSVHAAESVQNECRRPFISRKTLLVTILLLLSGSVVGAMLGANAVEVRTTLNDRVIEWRPSDQGRIEMRSRKFGEQWITMGDELDTCVLFAGWRLVWRTSSADNAIETAAAWYAPALYLATAIGASIGLAIAFVILRDLGRHWGRIPAGATLTGAVALMVSAHIWTDRHTDLQVNTLLLTLFAIPSIVATLLTLWDLADGRSDPISLLVRILIGSIVVVLYFGFALAVFAAVVIKLMTGGF